MHDRQLGHTVRLAELCEPDRLLLAYQQSDRTRVTIDAVMATASELPYIIQGRHVLHLPHQTQNNTATSVVSQATIYGTREYSFLPADSNKH